MCQSLRPEGSGEVNVGRVDDDNDNTDNTDNNDNNDNNDNTDDNDDNDDNCYRLVFFTTFVIYGFVPTIHWGFMNGIGSDEVGAGLVIMS